MGQSMKVMRGQTIRSDFDFSFYHNGRSFFVISKNFNILRGVSWPYIFLIPWNFSSKEVIVKQTTRDSSSYKYHKMTSVMMSKEMLGMFRSSTKTDDPPKHIARGYIGGKSIHLFSYIQHNHGQQWNTVLFVWESFFHRIFPNIIIFSISSVVFFCKMYTWIYLFNIIVLIYDVTMISFMESKRNMKKHHKSCLTHKS